MNRRGFFKSLGFLAGAASVSPNIFIPKFEPVRWKPPIIFKRPIVAMNPEYLKAQYEFRFIAFAGRWDFKVQDEILNELGDPNAVHFPIRWNKTHPNGIPKAIQPYLIL